MVAARTFGEDLWTAPAGNAAAQIAQSKGLLASGTIVQVEFDQLRGKLLAA